MTDWIAIFFEILKFTIPALIMFWAVQNLFKEFLEGQQRLSLLEIQKKNVDTTLPMRLTAYERLSLFCERISIPNLLFRLRTNNMQSGALRIALLMAIQQEYEHNISQQVYVSDKLWSIIKLSKEDTINLISSTAETINPSSNAKELSDALIRVLEEREGTPLLTAQSAIRKEASLLFGK